MKAIVYDVNGPPSVFRYEEAPDPVPAANEVLIAVEAISIEGGDLLHRSMAPPPRPAHIVGYQAAGRVIAVGAMVTRFKPGQRVATFNWSGGYAEKRAAPEFFVWPVPDALDIKIAASVSATFGTADEALFAFGRLQPGETVMVHGAAGGVGLAALQLARAHGARAIGITRGAERAARLADYGAHLAIDCAREDIVETARGFTGGRGVDLIVDMVGGDDFKKLMASCAPHGRISVVGYSSGNPPSIMLGELFTNAISVTGIMLGVDLHTDRIRAMVERHMALAAEGRERMPTDRVFHLSDAAAAHQHIMTGRPFGRTIMVP